jgi:non-ribosomal peptide synthetase-like protein
MSSDTFTRPLPVLGGTVAAGVPASRMLGGHVLLAAAPASGSRRDERLHELFERRVDALPGDHLAVDDGAVRLTYAELDARANRLARYLRLRGALPGDRVALLLDRAVDSYVAMLAVGKLHAAYVPLDPGFPADRVRYIVEDSGATLVLSTSRAAGSLLDPGGSGEAGGSGTGLGGVGVGDAELVLMDTSSRHIATMNSARLTAADRVSPRAVRDTELAYVIYTSGSTGRPKGVAVEQAAITNFVRVASRTYGYSAQDRVYQGLTIAFDFSVEEIWVPWMAGATLVPKPAGGSLLGDDLHEFLTSRGITAMCCVPTLLATLERDLPSLRILLVSGEACPQDLITRWARPGRRFLNVYGPTEATVTATWTLLEPGKPVTIGVPLPSYAIVVLDAQDPTRALAPGQTGEIGIAGVGLARGYVNRDDLTATAFIDDFLDIPDNPSHRIYRTGDLGRVNADGEIEYLGRIDLQVKVRGYRIELTEIESVLLEFPDIAAAVVNTYRPDPETVELVGYYSPRGGVGTIDQDAVYALLRERLPAYMVPAYLEQLAAIPMTTSDKADRKNLPAPSGRRIVAGPGNVVVAPDTELESLLIAELAATLGVEELSVTGNFFSDFGANSLSLARFAARVRSHPDSPPVAIRDVYANQTVRELAVALGGQLVEPVRDDGPAPEVVRGSSVGYVLTGVAQFMLFLVGLGIAGFILDRGFRYISTAPDYPAMYGRSALFTVGLFALWALVPIVAKWLLIGRWKPGRLRLWSAAYLRFWVVRTLLGLSPLLAFAGSPLGLWYLRSLGAKIGKDTAIFSRLTPVATDLLTVGDRTVVRRDTAFAGYRAIAGYIEIGSVSLGSDVVVGAKSLLDINTAMGDGAQLGHSSSLSVGQRVPAGQSWHGTPAEPSTSDFRGIAPARLGATRKIAFSLWQLFVTLVLTPLVPGIAVALLTRVPVLDSVLVQGPVYLRERGFYLVVAIIAVVAFVALLALGVLVMVSLPRLLARLVRPGVAYPLYGVRYLAQLLIGTLSNSALMVLLLGDSAFITGFVKALGYQMTPLVQTGSNFGTQHQHDSPTLTTIGAGTVISDGLSVVNMELSNSSFRVDRAVIGSRNFLGNNIVFPAGARTGSNVLLATKVMVPLDGPVRSDVGLLGSPAFEIPRANASRGDFPELTEPGAVRRLVRRKTWYNAGTLLASLASRTIQFMLLLQLAAAGFALYGRFGALAIAGALVAMLVVFTCYGLLMERAVMGFRRLRPKYVSIYDRYFWSHERLWKFYTNPALAGTPFQNVLWRLSGVRIGRRVFDDGTAIPEKSLVTIGDDAVLNAGTVIQNHSLEDGVFTSDYTVIGNGVTIGPSAFVHLGVTIGDGAVLDADSFLLKGSQMLPHTTWAGNPAQELPRHSGPVGPVGSAQGEAIGQDVSRS